MITGFYSIFSCFFPIQLGSLNHDCCFFRPMVTNTSASVFTKCTAVPTVSCILSSPSEPWCVSKVPNWEVRELGRMSLSLPSTHSIREGARVLLPSSPIHVQPRIPMWRHKGWQENLRDKHHDIVNIALHSENEIFLLGQEGFGLPFLMV